MRRLVGVACSVFAFGGVFGCASPPQPPPELPAACATEDHEPSILVLGSVRSPGRYPAAWGPDRKTLLHAIHEAGGTDAYAWRSAVTVTRRLCDGRTVRVRLDLRPITDGEQRDLRLAPGDIVHVPVREL
jgi:protein involved in polysaccharide export with SLBB domain